MFQSLTRWTRLRRQTESFRQWKLWKYLVYGHIPISVYSLRLRTIWYDFFRQTLNTQHIGHTSVIIIDIVSLLTIEHMASLEGKVVGALSRGGYFHRVHSSYKPLPRADLCSGLYIHYSLSLQVLADRSHRSWVRHRPCHGTATGL